MRALSGLRSTGLPSTRCLRSSIEPCITCSESTFSSAPGQRQAGVEAECVGGERRAVAPVLEDELAVDVPHVALDVAPADQVRLLVAVVERVADRPDLGVDLERDLLAAALAIAGQHLAGAHRALPVGERLVVDERVEALPRAWRRSRSAAPRASCPRPIHPVPSARRQAAPARRSGCSSVGEQLHAVDQARAGAGEVRGRVDGDDARRRAPASALGVVARRRARRAVEVVAARHHDHDLGFAAATSSQLAVRDFSPGRPSTSSPPAISIICGTQWPPTKTGSSHSSAATARARRRPRPRRARGRAGRRPRRPGATPAPGAPPPRPGGARRRASRRSSRGRARARGGCDGRRSATARTSSNETAHTSQTAWVTIRSGSSSSQRVLVELVERLAAPGALAHRGVDLGRARPSGMTLRVRWGLVAASGG